MSATEEQQTAVFDKRAAAAHRYIATQANGTLFVEIESETMAQDVKSMTDENSIGTPQRSIGSLTPDSRAGHLPADSWLGKLPWQVRASTAITLLGAPTASLILLAVDYFEYWRAVPFNLADFLVAFLLFAIPVGYVFGSVPMLLAAALYCALVTANLSLLQRRPLARACVAAICGGLASGMWFWEQLRTGWGVYALVGALVMAALSLGVPRPPQLLEPGGAEMGDETRGMVADLELIRWHYSSICWEKSL